MKDTIEGFIIKQFADFEYLDSLDAKGEDLNVTLVCNEKQRV
jgi:hypothetical protein